MCASCARPLHASTLLWYTCQWTVIKTRPVNHPTFSARPLLPWGKLEHAHRKCTTQPQSNVKHTTYVTAYLCTGTNSYEYYPSRPSPDSKKTKNSRKSIRNPYLRRALASLKRTSVPGHANQIGWMTSQNLDSPNVIARSEWRRTDHPPDWSNQITKKSELFQPAPFLWQLLRASRLHRCINLKVQVRVADPTCRKRNYHPRLFVAHKRATY